MKTTLALALPTLLLAAVAADPTRSPKFQHPLIKDHGGIVVLPDAAQQPKKNSKVLLDIISDEKTGKVIKGFDRAALILNQYTQAGAGRENGFKIAIILHGPATKAALADDAYAKHSNPYAKSQGATKNPNLELMRQLQKAGVEIYVCGQALAHHGYGMDEVAPEVSVAVSAAIHHVTETHNHLMRDVTFLASGVLLIGIGSAMIYAGRTTETASAAERPQTQ